MLLSNQDQKMIRLMTYLYRNNNKWLKFTDLVKFIKISKKTLHTYLDKLQDMFSEFTSFSYSGAMVKVHMSPNFGLVTMQRIFYSQDLAVRGLSLTFFNPAIHKFDLSIDLDVSESSIYRSIKSFNESLNEAYDLKFSYSDLCFQGDEMEIQKFYINFFIETNPNPSQWVFEPQFKEASANILTREIKKYIQYPLYPAHFDYIKTALAVASIRLKQGHTIPIYGYKEELMPKIIALSRLPQVEAVLNDEFSISHDQAPRLLYQILAFFLLNDFFLLFLEPEDQALRVMEQADHYKFFLSKLDFLCSKYKIKLDKPHAFYYQLYTYFKFKLSSVDSTDFFINHSEYILSYIKFINPSFYNDLKGILQTYLNIYHPKSKFDLDKLVYTVLTLWPGLLVQLLVKKDPIKCLIISRFDYFYAKTLGDIISLSISLNMDIEVYQDFEIDYEAIRQAGYDLIIVDFTVEEDLGDAIVYSFEQLPTIDRIQELFKAITYRDIQLKIDQLPEEFTRLKQVLGYTSSWTNNK